MSNRGKRGVSKGSKDFPGAVYEIEFSDKKLPCGKNSSRFMNDFNRLCEKHFPYWMEWKKIEDKVWDHVWESIKVQWNIKDNVAKIEMKKKANEAHRTFKSKLNQEFVGKNNNDPKSKYSFVNMTHWDEFVARCRSEEFKLKSAKAKASARQNKNPSRLGRTSFADRKDTWRGEWDQLVLQHPWLSVIQNDRSRKYALAHLPRDKTFGARKLTEYMEGTLRKLAEKEKNMLEDGTYHMIGRDPITQVFGKEHGGRTRGVATTVGVRKSLGWVKGDRERHEVVDIEAIEEKVTKKVTAAMDDKFNGQQKEMAALKAIVAHIQGFASDGYSDGLDDLEEPISCDLLWPYSGPDSGPDSRVAIGKVYPTRDATLHGSCLSEGYVKVQVDTIEEAFKAIPLPKPTDKVSILEHTMSEFIEWPRKKIKIHQTSSRCHSASRSSPSPTMPCQTPISDLSSNSCYRPQMEEDLMTFEHQMPSGGYMSLLESQVALHPQSGYPPASWPQMVEQALPFHPVTSESDEPKKTDEERVQERLVKLKDRPKLIKESASRFTKFNKQNISIVAPYDMYGKHWEEWIEYEAILNLHINKQVDITYIHWWAMHLHSFVKGLRENKCVFLNPHCIASTQCSRYEQEVVDHINDIKKLNPGKEIYVAPYLQGRHWLLFLVCPNLRKGYIVDSMKGKNTEKNYFFPNIVERAFEMKFDWTMAKCHQQEGTWECGYYMMNFMYDLAMKRQADFPKSLWDDTRILKPLEIDSVANMTLNEFYRAVVHPLETTAPQ